MMRYIFILVILIGWTFLSCSPTRSAETKEVKFVYEDEDRRDPFMPIVPKSGRILSSMKAKRFIKNVSLEGIIFSSEGESLVLINGEPHRLGDKVGGFQIKGIQSEKVILEAAGEEFVLELIKEEIK